MKHFLKKIAFTVVCCSLCVGLTACSGSTEGDPSETTSNLVAVTDENGEAVTDVSGNPMMEDPNALPPEKPLTVGFIYAETVEENVISQLFNNARLEAEKALGAETYYIENVLVSQFSDAVNKLVENGCNVIVSCSGKFKNAVKKEAQKASSINFVSFGGDSSLTNMTSFQGKLYQAAYVCGINAAFNSSAARIGVVADSSLINCYGTVNAFIQGAKELTGSKTDVRLNWSWANNDETTKNAIDDLANQGCDVIFAATTSEYAITYCNSLGIKVIGLAYNMPELAPETYLTGAFYNFGTYLIDALRKVRYETSSLNYVCDDGISAGTVRVVAVSSDCAEGTKDICDKLYALVTENKAKIFTGEIKDNYDNIRVEKGAVLTHREIWEIDWLDKCVTAIDDFTIPVLEPPESDLEIKE